MANYKFQNGLSESAIKMNNNADGRIIRCRPTVTLPDGRVFYHSHDIDNRTGDHREIVTLTNGDRININLNNGFAYDTQL